MLTNNRKLGLNECIGITCTHCPFHLYNNKKKKSCLELTKEEIISVVVESFGIRSLSKRDNY